MKGVRGEVTGCGIGGAGGRRGGEGGLGRRGRVRGEGEE